MFKHTLAVATTVVATATVIMAAKPETASAATIVFRYSFSDGSGVGGAFLGDIAADNNTVTNLSNLGGGWGLSTNSQALSFFNSVYSSGNLYFSPVASSFFLNGSGSPGGSFLLIGSTGFPTRLSLRPEILNEYRGPGGPPDFADMRLSEGGSASITVTPYLSSGPIDLVSEPYDPTHFHIQSINGSPVPPAAVPEPGSTSGALLLGGVGLAFLRKKKLASSQKPEITKTAFIKQS
jgi:hypothetical protein